MLDYGRVFFSRLNMNQYIDAFVGFLNEKGVEVEDYVLYDSPVNGKIIFKKR